MNVVWFAQSIDDESIDVVKSNRRVEDREAKFRLIQDAQKGVSVTAGKEWDFMFSVHHPFKIRGYLQPDRASPNGRKRTGIFMAEFRGCDSAQSIVEEVKRSLLCLGIESSEQQRKSFLLDLQSRIRKWRLHVVLGLAAVAAVTIGVVVKVATA